MLCLSALTSKAQLGYNYGLYDLGVSVGFNRFYGDVVTNKSTNAVNFNFTYNQTPFINYLFEFQLGTLAGGDQYKDKSGRQFSTDYQYYAMRLQLQAGELMDYSKSEVANAFKNLYLSTGFGLIYSKINSINRYSMQVPGFYTPGVDKAQEAFLPLRIGYELKIFNAYHEPNVKIDVGYQYNYVFGDDLDGFKVGHLNDGYGQFVIGAKISVGGTNSYRKQISYQ